MNQKVHVLIVDDQPYVREALLAFLTHIPNVVVVGEAIDGHSISQLIQKWEPDVVLMDIDRTEMSPEEEIQRIKQYWPDTRVVVLTMYASSSKTSLEAGADEVVLKGSPSESLKHAILTRNGQYMKEVKTSEKQKALHQ